MRSFIVMAMFVASLASAASSYYTEERDLELPAGGINTLTIHAGAGSLQVRGIAGSETIRVTARIQVDERNSDKARELIESRMVLKLYRDGDDAELQADFKNKLMGWGADGAIALEVEIPQGMHLDIEDSAGSIKVRDTHADVEIDDSSGSIRVEAAANVTIDDSSGSVTVDGATGDVDIEDGSGSVTVSKVGGSVKIDDGSGSIRVTDVEHDVVIDDAGSGGVTITDVRGNVEQET
jgi:hypothetical protein